MKLIPKFAFLIAGSGKHKDRLQAFDQALLDAGPLAHNLVTVSSILPEKCKIIDAKKGFGKLTPGQIVFCVMAKQDNNKKGGVASASIGVAKSKGAKSFGYISEHHDTTSNLSQSEKIAKKLAGEMLAKKLNVNINQLDLSAIASSIKNSGNEEWVCAVALLIFVI